MSRAELFQRLKEKGVVLHLDNGRLRVRAPKGALDADLRAELKRRNPEIVELLSRRASGEAEEPIPRQSRPAEEEGFPLSFAQQRLWFLDRLLPESFPYNTPLVLRLRGELDENALQHALRRIVRRHEILRSLFFEVDGEGRQRTCQDTRGALGWARCDLSSLRGGTAIREGDRLLRRENARAFDLERGPLLRVLLIRFGEEHHLLFINLHHIVSDGRSMEVLQRELETLYAAARRGRPANLADLPIQYTDFAVWQRRQLSEERLRPLLDFWRRELEDMKELELPADRPRKARPSLAGGRVPCRLPAALHTRLKTLAKERGATLFMVLLAAFEALLHRLCDQDDLVLGTPVANRRHAQLSDLFGFFVNTVALRSRIDRTTTFVDLLEQTRRRTLAALDHQDLPFERLVEELHRSAPTDGRNPIFQTVFALQGVTEPFVLEDLEVEEVILASESARFDLLVMLRSTESGIDGGFYYARELFDAATAGRLERGYRTLLETLAEDDAAPAARPIDELGLLTPGQRHQLLREWSGAEDVVQAGEPAALDRLFRVCATHHADATALVWEGGEMSYRELDRRSDAMARRLARLGVARETAVALLCERSPEMIVAMLAVLKAGGTYVPLDPSYPEERQRAMLTGTAAEVLISDRPEDGRRLAPGAHLVDSQTAAAQETSSEDGFLPAADPRQAAYVMFTSGSTGEPKGITVPHDAIARLVIGNDFAHFGSEEVLLQFAPTSFDASTLEIWGALLHGARLVLHPPGQPSLTDLGAFVERQGVTFLWLTSGLFHQMVDDAVDHLRGVRQLLSGGDVLSPEHVQRALASLPDTTLTNAYGPTENTTFTTCHSMRRWRDAGEGSVSIGRPIRGTGVHVLDRRLRPVAIGAEGELCTGGRGLARGYVGRPAHTAECFVPDPLSTAGGERLYRSGDLVRRRHGGEIEFVGRIDQQLKVRGFRVEPGEIEAVITAHAVAAQAVVIGEPDTAGTLRLVAYVVGPRGEPEAAELDELRRHTAATLPGYMVPAIWVPLSELPLTPNRKVDRSRLPSADEARESTAPYVAPSSATERTLAEVWASLLGLEPRSIGVDDDFFELGGHSLLATQMVSRLRQSLDVDLSLRVVFEAATLGELAERIDSLRTAARYDVIEPARRDGNLPLSFAQERLWFLEQLNPGESGYAASVVPLALKGELDVEALEDTFTALERRHETLRTTFRSIGGKPIQVVAPASWHRLRRIDLDHLATGDRQHQARQILQHERRRSYDLSLGPLFRTLLMRLAGDEHVLVIANHHIVLDGWTLGILIRELGELYGGFVTGRPVELPPLPVQYADYAVWQRRWLESEDYATKLDYWRRELDPPDAFARLAPDHPRRRASRARIVPFQVPGDTAEALRKLGRNEGTTLFMTLAAALQVLLYRATEEAEVAVGTPIANRNRPEIEGLVGFFVNTLVLRNRLDGKASFRDFLATLRRRTLDAYAHQDVPFEKLVEKLHPERRSETQPLFQVLFTLQNMPVPRFELHGLERIPFKAGEAAPKIERAALFDLSLGMGEPAGELRGRWEYDEAVFERATVETLRRGFLRLLDAIARDADGRIEELETFRPEEVRSFRTKAEPAGDEAPAETSAETAARVREKVRAELAAERSQLSETKRALLARRLHAKRAKKGRVPEGTVESPAAEPPAAGQRPPAPFTAVRAGTKILPRDLLEFRLARIWEELFEQQPIDVRDDFFQLGGRPTLAARLSERIQAELGTALPLTAIFEATTIEKQAEILRKQPVERPYSPLVTIRSGGSLPPFYCVHSADGAVVYYAELARLLGSQQPFYAFQARGVADGEETPLEDVQEMAELYLEALRAHHRGGPYFLGGWSFGGWVALEMARRLRALGEDVLLTVFDTHLWILEDGKSPALPSDETGWLFAFLQEIAADLFTGTPEELRRRDPDDVLSEVIEQAKALDRLPPDVTLADARRRFALFKAHSRATNRYRPEPYAGEVVLFRATGTNGPWPELLGWERIADKVTVVPVPGKHHEMVLSPQVEPLAEELGSLLSTRASRSPQLAAGPISK